MPAFDCSDDFVGIGGPCEGLGHLIILLDEAVYGGLKVDDRAEDAALEASSAELGEQAFDGVEPRARCRREVEAPPQMAREPGADLRMLMDGVVVEDNVDQLAGRNLRFNGVEEADELLMTVTLHVAADDRTVEDVERSDQGRGAVALVVVGHGSGATLLHRQAGLSAVERLDLALLVNRKHDGVRRRIDIEPDDITQLGDKIRIIGQLELAHPMWLKPVGAPDALDGAEADAGCFGHHRASPVGRLGWRIAQRQRYHPLGHVAAERRDARRPRLVTQEPVKAFLHKAFLPAPDASLRLAGPAHDLVGAKPLGCKQNNPSAPDLFLGGVAIPNQSTKTSAVSWRDTDRNSGAHAKDSHGKAPMGIPIGIQPLDIIH